MPKEQLNSGHYHEVCDRTSMIEGIIDDYLVKHPAVKANKDWKKRLMKVQEELAAIYQEAGQLFI